MTGAHYQLPHHLQNLTFPRATISNTTVVVHHALHPRFCSSTRVCNSQIRVCAGCHRVVPSLCDRYARSRARWRTGRIVWCPRARRFDRVHELLCGLTLHVMACARRPLCSSVMRIRQDDEDSLYSEGFSPTPGLQRAGTVSVFLRLGGDLPRTASLFASTGPRIPIPCRSCDSIML